VNDAFLQFKDVWFSYGDAPPALRGIDLEMGRGEAIGLVGQNGSGKTTLAKHMNGLLRPERGRVFLNGLNTRETTTGDLAAIAGYVFQNPDHQIFSPTVEQEIAFGPRNLGLTGDDLQQRIDQAIKRFGLDDVRERHPTLLGRGIRRRVAIASVYALQPRLMILDEPTGGLDRRHSLELIDLMRGLVDEGRTVILISHDMRLVGEFAERLLIMRDGSIVADGGIRDLLPDEDRLSEASLTPPEISRLARTLQPLGFRPSVRLSDFRDQFLSLHAQRSRRAGTVRES
jgi:energy-coupling factor transporter ATP-binding protein EcfA2